MSKIKLPKNQVIKLTYLKDNKPLYVVTYNEITAKYFLYKVYKDKLEKLKSSISPCFEEVGY